MEVYWVSRKHIRSEFANGTVQLFRWVIQGPSNSLSVEKKSNEVHKRAMSLTQSTVSDCLTEQQVKCKTSKIVRLSAEMAGCSLRFDGIPFQIVGVKILECQNGPDRNKALKLSKRS